MTYADEPPYEVLQTDALRFEELQRLKRFARLWDLVANRGQFPRTLPILLGDAPFASFEAFTVWVSGRVEQLHGIELLRLFRLVFEWLVARGHDVDAVRATLAADYDTGARRLPRFLQEGGTPTTEGRKARRDRRQARQERHSGQR